MLIRNEKLSKQYILHAQNIYFVFRCTKGTKSLTHTFFFGSNATSKFVQILSLCIHWSDSSVLFSKFVRFGRTEPVFLMCSSTFSNCSFSLASAQLRTIRLKFHWTNGARSLSGISVMAMKQFNRKPPHGAIPEHKNVNSQLSTPDTEKNLLLWNHKKFFFPILFLCILWCLTICCYQCIVYDLNCNILWFC